MNEMKIPLRCMDRIFKINHLQFEPTNQCNLKCSICLHSLDTSGNEFGEISFDDFKKTVDQFSGIEEITLQGVGEPFLAKDIFLMVKYARQKNITAGSITNATLLSEEYCRGIIESGLSLLRASVDSCNPDTYSKIKVGSDINQVMGNLKRLNRIKKELKSETPRLSINTVLLRENINELKPLIELAVEVGANQIWLIPLFIFGKGLAVQEESMSSHKELFLEKIIEAKSWAEKHNIKLESGICVDQHPASEALSQEQDWPCTRGCYINFKGELSPCCNIFYSFGNIIQNPLYDLWNVGRYAKFRTYILENRPSCKKCKFDIDQLKILENSVTEKSAL